MVLSFNMKICLNLFQKVFTIFNIYFLLLLLFSYVYTDRYTGRQVDRQICVLSCFSSIRLFATPWTVALPGSSVRGISQTRMACHTLLQSIFQTGDQLFHYRQILYPLSDLGSSDRYTYKLFSLFLYLFLPHLELLEVKDLKAIRRCCKKSKRTQRNGKIDHFAQGLDKLTLLNDHTT